MIMYTFNIWQRKKLVIFLLFSMWTVVHFRNEDAVEAVPSHWVKKDTSQFSNYM